MPDSYRYDADDRHDRPSSIWIYRHDHDGHLSARDCAHSDPKICARNLYDKITKSAEKLVPTGEAIERELGIPIK